ncbi:MAG TPA: histidine kinase N-terminal 7TM domain-containing protein [Rectinemataceae bacterium]|nr:histidine kinase N-terminal 7TM domain-containing protein [Rectinemataceae bacterium]
MNDVKIIITTLLICSCMGILFICGLALQKRSTSGMPAVFLALCGFCVVIYDFGYAMEIYAITLPDVLFWVRFEHLGIQLIPVLWLMFALSVMGRKKLVTLRTGLFLFFPPLVALACSQTLGGLNLMHPNPRLADGDVISLFKYDRGCAMYLVTAVQSGYIAAGIIIFTIGLIRGAPLPRKQTVIYWLASLLPWVSSLAYNLGKLPYNIDATPLVLSLSVAIFMFGFLGPEILETKS